MAFGMAQTRNMGKAVKQNGIHMIGSNDGGGESAPVFSSGNNTVPDNMSLWVLPSTGGTSSNTRAPGNTYRYQRTEYLITPAEMAASGFPNGAAVDAIGWLVGTAGATSQTGTLNIWLMNTANNTYLLGTSWTVAGFTQVSSNSSWTVPIAAGSYTVPFTGGSTFTYTGGGVYVAWEFSNPGGTLGTTAVIHLCNLNLTNGLYGQRSNTSMPTTLVASNWRPATTFTNNYYTDVLQVTNIYVQEKCPIPYGVPTTPSARVLNVGTSAETFTLTLQIKDQATSTVRYSNVQTVTALAAGAAQVVSFTPWTATITENDNVTVTASAGTGENWLTNNAMTIPMNINTNLYGFCYNLVPSTGYGFTYTTAGGIFATKFHMNGQGSIPSANLFIYNYAANTGNVIYAVVLNSAGTIVAQTPNYTILSTDLGTNKNFSFPVVPTFTNEDFYVGLAQPTGGTVQWYPIGCMVESPYRANTFYTFDITGGTPALFGADYKYMIEAVVAPPSLPAHDVGTLSIDMNQVVTLGTLNPKATVKNFGANTETFTVTMTIGAYSSTKTVYNLASGLSTQVTFDPWTNGVGNYTVTVCTSLPGDLDATNDCKTQTVKVLNLNKVVYGYDAYAAASTDPEGPLTFTLSDPGNLTPLADQSLLAFIAGGTWANGTWYGTEYGTAAPYNLVKISTLTGARTVVGNMGVNINGLSYNPANGIMYGVGYNSTATTSDLYTINLCTGLATLVGSTTAGILLPNLAINNAGQAYAMDITSDNFGSVNLATGAFTVIGPLGFNASYAQDMEFDRDANELYMAAYSSIGELRWVDVTTGNSLSVGSFEGGAEVTGFAIPCTGHAIIAGTLDVGGIPPPETGLSIVASPRCNTAVQGTLENGGVEYSESTGTYIIHPFPCHPLSPGDLVDLTFYDGIHFRSVTAEVNGDLGLTVIVNVSIVVTWSRHLNYTQYVYVAIPPGKTLYVHYSGVQWPYHRYWDGTQWQWGGCANTHVEQWDWNLHTFVYYAQWNFNPDSTVRQITNNDAVWHCKRFHCDDHLGFTIDFTLVSSTGINSPGNPEAFASVNLGGRDGFACEFGNITAPSHSFVYQTGAQLQQFPQRLGTDGVQNLTIQFESYDNTYWGDMDLNIDLVNVAQPGTLELYLPDATIPLTAASIAPGQEVVTLHPGGILVPGIHTMTLVATGGLSMGIDCFNFVSNAGITYITGVIDVEGGGHPSLNGLSIIASPRCNQGIQGTLENGVVEYNEVTGTYMIHSFPGYTLSTGDLVDITVFDGTHSRSLTVTITPTLPVTVNIIIVINWWRHMHYTEYAYVAIPPHSTLYIHYNGVQWPYHRVWNGTRWIWGGCGNTDVQQWNGTRWVYYRQWNWNPDSTVRKITNNDPYWHFKRIHCDDHFGFDLDFHLVMSIEVTSPGNPQTFASLNLGGRDGFACEFGNINATNHTFIYEEGAYLDNFPQRLSATGGPSTEGVQNLTIQFEAYANEYWGDMTLAIDLVNVTQPGTLQLSIPGATEPSSSVQVNAGDTVCYFNPGGILAPGIHTMTLSATGGLSMGIDCFNFISNTGPVMITGNIDLMGSPPPMAGLSIVASPHCDHTVVGTLENGVVEYNETTGIYQIHEFPGYTLSTGDLVDITVFDGTHFRSLTAQITAVLPVHVDIVIVINWSVTLAYTQWTTVAIPPNSTLLIHYSNVGSCGNTDILQWNGTSWYMPPYTPWWFNADSTTKQITNNTSSWVYKRFHCDDHYGMTLDFTLVIVTGITSPSNPWAWATVNLGGRDLFNCEFGDIISSNHTFAYQTGATLNNFPRRLGAGGVQNLTVMFESYDNIYWGDMQLTIDLMNVTQPGTLELYIPDAMIPLNTVPITVGQTSVTIPTGGIVAPGMHAMSLMASGGLSMGIDCFNYTTNVSMTPPLITGTLANESGIPPSLSALSIVATPRCDHSVQATLQNGGIEYAVVGGVGTYRVNSFPGYAMTAGDIVDITIFDGVNSRSESVAVAGDGSTVTLDIIIVVNWSIHLNHTDWVIVAIPPNTTLKIHYSGVASCGNTDIMQWNGVSWYVPPYSPWWHNHDSTTKYIRNNDTTWHFKAFHCDDPGGFTVDFTTVIPYQPTSTGNPASWASINLGGRDGRTCEFGTITGINYSFVYQPGAVLQSFPSVLGDNGVQNLTVQFESYDNIYWSDMQLQIDLVNVTQPGTIVLNIPDATNPVTVATVFPGQQAAYFNPGGLLPGYHVMTLSTVGQFSAGIDCFNFTTIVPVPTNKTLHVTAFLEGLYMGGGMMNQAMDDMGPHFGPGIADQIIIELHNDADYPTVEFTSGPVDLGTDGNATVSIPSAFSGLYWITVLHRNHITTVSAAPVSFAGGVMAYNFTTAASQAFMDNQKDEGDGNFAFWAGDVNQDGIVDSGDMNPVDNASTAITFGYIPEDVNGDGLVDSGDMNIVDNNSTAVIMAWTP